MEAESSLPYSQKPATCPCSDPDQSSPCFPIKFLKIHFTTIFNLFIDTYIF